MINGRTIPLWLLPADSWRAWTMAAISIIALWLERGRSRRVLAALDDDLLHDIGITRTDAQVESEKPFWIP
jgi:uncharacterized protein YjiS (DUF1127 family)